MSIESLATPCFVIDETRLRRNLELIADVERRAGVNIIMAFKANAVWRTFPIIAEYNRDFTASSLNELTLGCETLGGEAHVYCPVYTPQTIDRFLAKASHITFNSLSQLERFGILAAEASVSAGLRVNPLCSVVETDLYNPSLPGSRFGVTAADMPATLPPYLEGLHFHALCEGTSHDLERVLEAFENQFGPWLPGLKWVNMGGGHLMTREGYDVNHLVAILTDFRRRHPNLQVILEPGSAWTWRTGDLITTVLDVVENAGVRTAIIDASFACHMPDCLEMPYRPAVTEAVNDDNPDGIPYRLGGNSCLSGDFAGPWKFARPLSPGQRLTLEDMNHYTTVKTTMFNGLQHPDIVLREADGNCRLLRRFAYEDYKNRMS